MKKGLKILSLLLAVGMMMSVASCAGLQTHVGANQVTETEDYKVTITSVIQGKTLSLLEGEIGEFAATYAGSGHAKQYAVGDYKTDRYAPAPAKIEWNNTREGALYYTLKIGLKKDLSDAESFLTTDTYVAVENLFAAKTYYYQVIAHYEGEEVVKSSVFDFRTADLPRTVWIEGISNTRDIGGRFTEDGKYQVKQGMIYRGGHGDNITENGKHVFLNVLGIKTDLDLREGTRPHSPIDASLNFVNVSGPYYYYGPGSGILSPSYKEALITEMKTFANPDNYPIYLHCSLGRDRAGTLAFLVSALLGIGERDLYRDYETSFFSVNGFADADQGAGKIDELMNAFSSLYRYIQTYGDGTLAENTAKFCKEYLGMTQTEIDTIRSVMLEEV